MQPADDSIRFNPEPTKLREFEIEAQAIIDTEIKLKEDIWEGRAGEVQSISAFHAILNAASTLASKVPLEDPMEVALWLFNGKVFHNPQGGKVVEYDNEARDDINNAFKSLTEAFRCMDPRFNSWLRSIEKVLGHQEDIGIVRRPVLDFLIFTWAYTTTCSKIFALIDDGIKPIGEENDWLNI
ncbi:hypothetical protein ABW19_dt0210416 [Dactylella cylindrospora]|nr:hypothetical protein ABW19_dt0210416 [Dactylella cylindrospora]